MQSETAALTADRLEFVRKYHDGTKHHFHRFASSLGYLDWASQPRPFRSFAGAPEFRLPETPPSSEAHSGLRFVTYDALYSPHPAPASALTALTIADVFRHALGLSAWKQFGASRWALRVNPSSGNLHPTEAYLVAGPVPGLADTAAVYHYASDRHLLEQRCAFDSVSLQDAALVVLTSIHWREAWKYGERAFRYCQHDLGHAIAAVRLAASLAGWKLTMCAEWSAREIAALAGLDRDEDYLEAEREEPACVLAITPGQAPDREPLGADSRQQLIDGVRGGRWFGHASQLSEEHVEWTFIDEVARATEDEGRDAVSTQRPVEPGHRVVPPAEQDARSIVIQRRSAVALDGRSSIDRARFLAMLARTLPGPHAPWDAIWWTPRIHLALFVHRVDGVDPGFYVMPRDSTALDRLKTAFNREFVWQPADDELPLYCLGVGDSRGLAKRLSCDQDIAADGFFSLGMIAEFDASLREHGPSFYRRLFWESGIVGQVLYLEAEAAGTRATGIGCFYDDPVHDVLGLTDHSFQSLYHFTVGLPVEDTRLTTRPGYDWEL